MLQSRYEFLMDINEKLRDLQSEVTHYHDLKGINIHEWAELHQALADARQVFIDHSNSNIRRDPEDNV